MKNDIAVVVPAYNPGYVLFDVLNSLQKDGFSHIVVVNDGSNDDSVFQSINNKAVVLQHDKNLGKGQALKTGFCYCKNNIGDIIGVITVDADGQHSIEDVNKLYMEFHDNKKSLILGSRQFEGNIPFRSKLGNKLACEILERKTKARIKDTQTGLRAIPIEYIDDLIKLEGNGYEYEMNMLLYFINKKISIIEKPINTIYINKNKQSKFKALRDSLKIYKTIKNAS